MDQQEIQLGHTVSLHSREVFEVTVNGAARVDRWLLERLCEAFMGLTRQYTSIGFYVLDNAGNRAAMTALGYSLAQQERYITGVAN